MRGCMRQGRGEGADAVCVTCTTILCMFINLCVAGQESVYNVVMRHVIQNLAG